MAQQNIPDIAEEVKSKILNNVPGMTISGHFQGHLLRMKVNQNGISGLFGGGVRGLITDFSRASRKRLLDLFATLEIPRKTIFITLTYGQSYPDMATAKTHLRALQERFRRAYPEMSNIWRIELQERGASHFHLMLFNMPFLPKADLKKMWGEIIGKKYWDYSKFEEGEEPFTRIEMISSWRKGMAYVSKYIAKVRETDEAVRGCGFNNITYLHAGRCWGVHKRSKLPYAPSLEFVLEDLEAIKDVFYSFRRGAKAYFSRTRTGSPYKGFSLYTDDIGKWADYWRYLLKTA